MSEASDGSAPDQKPGEVEVAQVRIDSLSGSNSPRLAGENPGHLRALAEIESPLPPILVHRPSMRVIDGMHRVRVAEMRGEQSVQARFFDGDDNACFVLAVEANIHHGLPLSLADRKAAAARIISSYPQWSDRRIAAVAGVSTRTVAALRERPTGRGANRQESFRIGRDGRARPVDAASRREHARKLLADNPDASLRVIAREAGISPETVRDLRARMRAGAASERGEPQGGKDSTGAGAARTEKDDLTKRPPHKPGIGNDFPALSTLMADPALRSTEIGRALLRSLNTSAAVTGYRRQISASVPAYCLPKIIEAALTCHQIWEDLAIYLERCHQRNEASREEALVRRGGGLRRLVVLPHGGAPGPGEPHDGVRPWRSRAPG
jgi:hypothetical protein